MKTNRIRGTMAVALAVFGLAGSAAAAPYVVLKGGNRVEGTSIRAQRDGTIVLEIAGQGSRSFSKDMIEEAFADRPGEIDQARQLVAAKNYDQAVTLLEDVYQKYRFLGWDLQALRLLPQVYDVKGDAAAELDAYERLLAADPEAEQDSEVLSSYLGALLGAKAYAKLEPKLNQLISGGDRTLAAKAQLIRGDMQAAQNHMEDALLDYMRTAILFKDVKDQQAEALFKSASALESLRDQRAKEFYRKVVDEYPASPYAQQAKSKL